MDICSSPKLFAAYHVFHRPLVPRHPPCALSAWPFAFHHPSVGDAVVDSHCLINKFIDVFLSNVLRLYQGYLIKFNQIYMYAVFNVQSWLIFYQSFKEKISFLLKSLVKQPVSIFIRFPCFSFFDLAATCSPTSSPMQYHRPLRS